MPNKPKPLVGFNPTHDKQIEAYGQACIEYGRAQLIAELRVKFEALEQAASDHYDLTRDPYADGQYDAYIIAKNTLPKETK